MCYICNCFTWTLDLIQRLLTFCLSCWLACAVCCGLTVAVMAGIAYGYNYCLAEFIMLTRSDVRVFLRRGQFYDKPAFKHRRSGDDNDAFPSNLTDEYQQEVPPGEDSLSGKWEKDQDTRKYAEKLTKYSDTRKNGANVEQSDKYYQQEDPSEDYSVSEQWEKDQDTRKYSGQRNFVDAAQQVNLREHNIYDKPTRSPTFRVPILPNSYIPTTVLRSGASEIGMRMFDPVSTVVPVPRGEAVYYDEKPLIDIDKEPDMNTTTLPEDIERKTIADPSNARIQFEDSPTRKVIQMRHWGTSSKPIKYGDEDNVVYKTV